MTQQNTTLSLRPEFRINKEDSAALNALPDNLPDTKLTEKQKDLVNTLYHKYIYQNRVTYGWGTDIYRLEQKEKWPSAGKVKIHEAKRMILGWLDTYTQHYDNLTDKKALEFVMQEITCREADRILISKAYEIK